MKENSQDVIIGIDVSKDKLDVWNSFTSKHTVLKNDRRCLGSWFKKQKDKYSHLQLLLEPSGSYEKQFILQSLASELKVSFVHPNHFKHYKKSLGLDAKTDKLDAQLLARYMGEDHKRVNLIGPEYADNMELMELSARRKQIKAAIHDELCREGNDLYSKPVKKSIKQRLAFLKKDLKNIEQGIDEALMENEKHKEKMALLQTVKGVGRVTAQTLIIGMPELGQVTNREASRLLGVAPINHDSGKRQGKRFISGGRGDIRKVVYMAALVAIKHNEELREYFEKLRARGKLFKVALVAVMRKLICILNAMARDNKPYKRKAGPGIKEKGVVAA